MPLQLPVAAPASPNRPGGHAPVQLAFAISTVAPNRPALQSLQAVAPGRAKVPTGQEPLQAEAFSPGTTPNRPAGHSTQTAAPAVLYWPAGHLAAVALTLPSGHAYPAVQLPLQPLAFMASDSPKRPPGQGEHAGAPPTLYWPAGHLAAVALVEPSGQKYPALQLAVQLGADRPVADPNRPAAQGPLQLVVGSAVDAPYRPALQLEHAPVPPRLNCPGPHGAAVALAEPGGQK